MVLAAPFVDPAVYIPAMALSIAPKRPVPGPVVALGVRLSVSPLAGVPLTLMLRPPNVIGCPDTKVDDPLVVAVVLLVTV